jgi:hypothetical protein
MQDFLGVIAVHFQREEKGEGLPDIELQSQARVRYLDSDVIYICWNRADAVEPPVSKERFQIASATKV